MNSIQEVREMRTAEMELSIIRERKQRGPALTKMVTGEPGDTEIGQARFGGGRLEKCPQG